MALLLFQRGKGNARSGHRVGDLIVKHDDCGSFVVCCELTPSSLKDEDESRAASHDGGVDLEGHVYVATETAGTVKYGPTSPESHFVRGDCDGSREVTADITDNIFVLNLLFLGGPSPVAPALPAAPAPRATG
jgi:hypothetical protein